MLGTIYLRRITREGHLPAAYQVSFQEGRGAADGRTFSRSFSSPDDLRFFLASSLHISPEAVTAAVTEVAATGASELRDLDLREIDLAGEHMQSLPSQY